MTRYGMTLVMFLLLYTGICGAQTSYGSWMKKPRQDWPPIAMVNSMTYTDKHFPIGGCGFLLDAGEDTLAVTAKHVLTYFKSESMQSVDFGGTLKEWNMFPKNRPDIQVTLGRLVNADPDESLASISVERDWLVFTLKQGSALIQPLKFRTSPLVPDEPVFIIGWRYSDRDCPQVVYEGAVIEDRKTSVIISTKKLADNTMPGLSGCPVIDSRGYLIGIMSQKAGVNERLAPLTYLITIVGGLHK